jgi:hypothetical protein
MANTPFPPLLARLEDRMVKNDPDAKAKAAKKKQPVPSPEDGE